jgi:hypothetical protein
LPRSSPRAAHRGKLQFLPWSGALRAFMKLSGYPNVIFKFCRYSINVAVPKRLRCCFTRRPYWQQSVYWSRDQFLWGIEPVSSRYSRIQPSGLLYNHSDKQIPSQTSLTFANSPKQDPEPQTPRSVDQSSSLRYAAIFGVNWRISGLDDNICSLHIYRLNYIHLNHQKMRFQNNHILTLLMTLMLMIVCSFTP